AAPRPRRPRHRRHDDGARRLRRPAPALGGAAPAHRVALARHGGGRLLPAARLDERARRAAHAAPPGRL
ncbi:MAG: hypothetical protein AVDCRST_MAG11-3323, partial [uncultured Gemmatimonadaceae bacterium]